MQSEKFFSERTFIENPVMGFYNEVRQTFVLNRKDRDDEKITDRPDADCPADDSSGSGSGNGDLRLYHFRTKLKEKEN